MCAPLLVIRLRGSSDTLSLQKPPEREQKFAKTADISPLRQVAFLHPFRRRSDRQ